MAQKPLEPGYIGKAPNIGVRLPTAQRNRLDQLAAQHGLTRSAMVRELVNRALAERSTGPARTGSGVDTDSG